MVLYNTSRLLRISQDIQCVLQRSYKVRIIYFFEKSKSFRKSKSFGKFKSFIKKKNKGFFITLRICLVILGMLTASADF